MDRKKELVVPYDLDKHDAWVSVGISHDTAEFAVATVRTVHEVFNE